MDIFLKFSDDGMAEGMKFPILPSSFRIKGGMNNTEVNVNSVGTINLLGKRGLFEIEFESFFPKQNYSFCKCAPLAPYSYCGALQERMHKNDIGVLTITGTNISLKCTIQSFEYGEEDNSGDVYYSIAFKEYREISASRVSKKTTKTTYKTKKGDTFYTISRKFYGNSVYAKDIQKANANKKGKCKYKLSYKFKKKVKIIIPAV